MHRLLLQAGADPLHRAIDGRTILDESEDLDAYVLEVLRRKRERALQTAHATARLKEKTKLENLRSREQYAEAERKRREAYKANLASNDQKLAGKYDDSPFRHNVGVVYNRIRMAREKEAQLEHEHAKIFKKLEAMTGTPEIDAVRLAPREVVDRVASKPIARLELERYRVRVDGKELKKELTFLSKMVNRCLVDTQSKFPVLLQNNPQLQAMMQPAVPKPLLAPHSAFTTFIRNDPDLVRASAFQGQ